MRFVPVCCLIAVLLLTALLMTSSAQAGERRRLAREARLAREQALPVDVARRSPALDPRAIYPKYQGGFNSRALENIGVPTGDIGIRGNGFMMNPW